MSTENQNDMSMEEILASIRKIIATDDEHEAEISETEKVAEISETEKVAESDEDTASDAPKETPKDSKENAEEAALSTKTDDEKTVPDEDATEDDDNDSDDEDTDDDVLELTQEVQKDGSVVDLSQQSGPVDSPEYEGNSTEESAEKTAPSPSENGEDADTNKADAEEKTSTEEDAKPSASEADVKEDALDTSEQNDAPKNSKTSNEESAPESKPENAEDDAPIDVSDIKSMDTPEEDDIILEELNDLTDMLKDDEDIEADAPEMTEAERDNTDLEQAFEAMDEDTEDDSENSPETTDGTVNSVRATDDVKMVHTPEDTGLVSDTVAAALSSSLADLNILSASATEPDVSHVPPHLSNPSTTLEDMIVSAVRPMLKEWIETHLPQMMRDIIQEEIRTIIDKKFR